ALSHEKGSKQYNSILLEIIPRHFPDDAIAHNNTAAVLITNGETVTAARLLDKAGETPEALNNRGVLYLLGGDLDKAEACFDRAQQAGSEEAALNKEEVQTKRADNQKMERYSRMKQTVH
ncbi:MAG TPA: tetratricopeptide repeat protein, partial [Bacteroides reticulotermitis]|nr:tetratricopeptide repeat protein [Bacteroides reticulotermitis]